MKFKIGDKVKVKASSKPLDGDVYANKEGYVRSILKGGYHTWPYRAEFEGGFSNYFSARELEKVEEE